jgi:hypothetical protein
VIYSEYLLCEFNKYQNIIDSLNNYAIKKLNDIRYDEYESLENACVVFNNHMTTLITNKYDPFCYAKLLVIILSDLTSWQITRMTFYSLFKKNNIVHNESLSLLNWDDRIDLITFDKLIVSKLKELKTEFNIQNDSMIEIIFANFEYMLIYSNLDTTVITEHILWLIQLTKLNYLNKFTIKSTNKWYSHFIMLKHNCTQHKYPKSDINCSVPYFTSNYDRYNTLDVYLIELLKEEFPDDIISNDDLIDMYVEMKKSNLSKNKLDINYESCQSSNSEE